MLNRQTIRAGGSMGQCWRETFSYVYVCLILTCPWTLVQAIPTSLHTKHQNLQSFSSFKVCLLREANSGLSLSYFLQPFTWTCSTALLYPQIEDPWKQALFLLPQPQGHLTKEVFIKYLLYEDHESHLHYSSWLPPSILVWAVSDTSGCYRYDPCVTHNVRKLPGCPSQVLTEGQLPQPAPNFLSRRSQSVSGKPKPPEGNFSWPQAPA